MLRDVRLVEVRLLDGPNVYRLEPTVKVEVMVGRRRTWFGQRMPEPHAVVRLGVAVPAAHAPPPIRDVAAWVTRLHTLTGAAHWLSTDRPLLNEPAPGRHRLGRPPRFDPGHQRSASVEGAWRAETALTAYALMNAALIRG
jgi:hypothetical protein